VLRCCQTSHFL